MEVRESELPDLGAARGAVIVADAGGKQYGVAPGDDELSFSAAESARTRDRMDQEEVAGPCGAPGRVLRTFAEHAADHPVHLGMLGFRSG